MKNWTNWKPMPMPESCRQIDAPVGPGVYQIKNKKTLQFVQFGIGDKCLHRMKSLYPAPFGSGTRNNADKRAYILRNWSNLEYRTMETDTKQEAKNVEDNLKAQNNHIFNT